MSDVSLTEEEEAERQRITAERMAVDGYSAEEKVQEDYFGFDELLTVTLPDGVSWVQHQVFNEGKRRKYLNAINRDVTLSRQTGDAKIRMAPGDERNALLKNALVGWNLQRGGQPVPFNQANLEKFLDSANPKLIDLIEKEVRKANPWLLAEVSVEDIEKEIAELQELRQTKLDEQAGNSPSSIK